MASPCPTSTKLTRRYAAPVCWAPAADAHSATSAAVSVTAARVRCEHMTRLVGRVGPDRLDRLGDKVGRIRARPRLELLHAPAVHCCNVEVAVLVAAHSVHAPQAAGEVAHRA